MAVDLGDLIEPLKASPGGASLFPDFEEEDWLQRLANGFWSGRLAGLFADYRVDDNTGEIVPVVGTEDLGRDQQQLIVLWSSYTNVQARLLTLPTTRRRKAGPVELEDGYSAQVFTKVLDQLRSELNTAAGRLNGSGDPVPTLVLDAVWAREQSAGMYYWVN